MNLLILAYKALGTVAVLAMICAGICVIVFTLQSRADDKEDKEAVNE